MAARRLSAWGKWQQTRNTLSTSLGLNIDARNESVSGSADERQLNRNIDQILADMQVHALNGLRMVDLEIANAGLVDAISKASEAAKKEADRLKEATSSVDKLTALVGQVTALVGLFSGL